MCLLLKCYTTKLRREEMYFKKNMVVRTCITLMSQKGYREKVRRVSTCWCKVRGPVANWEDSREE